MFFVSGNYAIMQSRAADTFSTVSGVLSLLPFYVSYIKVVFLLVYSLPVFCHRGQLFAVAVGAWIDSSMGVLRWILCFLTLCAVIFEITSGKFIQFWFHDFRGFGCSRELTD